MKFDEIINGSPYYEIRQMVNAKGELLAASKRIEELRPQDELKADTLKSCVFLCQYRLVEALNLLNKIIERKNEVKDEAVLLHVYHFKIYVLLLSGNISEAKKTIERLALDEKVDDMSPHEQIFVQEAIAMLYQVQASYYGLYLGDHKRGIELGKKALELAEYVSSTNALSWIYYILSAIYQHKEDLDLGFEYAKKGEKIALENDHKIPLALIYFTLGRLFGLKGDSQNLVKYMNESFSIGKETGIKVITNLTTGEIGLFYSSKGLYDQAIEQFRLGLQLAKERNDSFVIIKRFCDLGHIYQLRGDIQRALGMFRESLVMSTQLNNKPLESRMFYAIGSVYFDQGIYQDSLEMFQKSYSIQSNHTPKSILCSSVLYALVLVSLELNQIENARNYLKKLEELSRGTSNENIKLNYQLSQALTLKTSPRMRHKSQAQEIFESISKNVTYDHSSISFALFNLCDLLIFEYKSTREIEVLEEIKSLSERLYTIGQKNHAYPTIIKALLLQAKLALVEGRLEKAQEILAEANEISKNKGFGHLLKHVVQEEKEIIDEITKWNELIARNAPVQERLQKADLEKYIKKALHVLEAKFEGL